MTAPTPSPQTPRALLEALHTAHDGASGSKCYEAGMALIAARDASLTAPLRAEVEDAKGALEDAAAHEDNDTASVADRIVTLAEDRDFFRSAWFAVLDAMYPHRLPDDQFDPKEVAQEIDAIATEAESLRADVERLREKYDAVMAEPMETWTDESLRIAAEKGLVVRATCAFIHAMKSRADRAEAENARLQNALIDGVRKLVEDGNAKIPKQFRTLESPDQIGDAFRFAEREVARLRAALQPFADLHARFIALGNPHGIVDVQFIGLGQSVHRVCNIEEHLRAAAKALAPEGGK